MVSGSIWPMAKSEGANTVNGPVTLYEKHFLGDWKLEWVLHSDIFCNFGSVLKAAVNQVLNLRKTT